MLRDLKLDRFQYCSWTWEVVKGDEANFEGEIISTDGARAPVLMTMLKQEGEWKLFSLRTKATGDVIPMENKFSLLPAQDPTNVFKKSAPPLSEVKKLVKDSLLIFNSAIQTKDFSAFFNSLPKSWQDKLSKRQMDALFQPFIDKRVDISSIKDVDPVFDSEPHIDAEGRLLAHGFYPASPAQVRFDLTYTYDLPTWKLSGIQVSLAR